ncbi:MAG: hypothetical protein WAZ30_07495 [Syntrophorhabdus sp.]
MHSRKTYIACVHTYVHGKAGGCEKCASSLQPKGARRAAEEEACHGANLGRVDSQDCRYRRRVNRISRSSLTKAGGAKDVLHMTTLLEGINSCLEGL